MQSQPDHWLSLIFKLSVFSNAVSAYQNSNGHSGLPLPFGVFDKNQMVAQMLNVSTQNHENLTVFKDKRTHVNTLEEG